MFHALQAASAPRVAYTSTPLCTTQVEWLCSQLALARNELDRKEKDAQLLLCVPFMYRQRVHGMQGNSTPFSHGPMPRLPIKLMEASKASAARIVPDTWCPASRKQMKCTRAVIQSVLLRFDHLNGLPDLEAPSLKPSFACYKEQS